jgi:hypothetical protein
MVFDFPLYAVQCSGPGRWLVWAPDDDPCASAICVVAVLEEPAYHGAREPQSSNVIRAFRTWQSRIPEARAEINNIVWPREELLEVARLLDHLDTRDIERFCLQRSALAHELRRLARWAPRPS